MVDAALASSKRRQQSEIIFRVLTRSKSQIYLHRNRSGRTRTDTIRLRTTQNINFDDLQPSAKKPRREASLLRGGSAHAGHLSSISVKDLRSKRVFSPSIKNVGGADPCSRLYSGVEKPSGKLSRTEELVGVPSNGVVNGFSCEEHSAIAEEEKCVQSTPPDVETFGVEKDIVRKRSETAEFQFLEKKPNHSDQRKGDFQVDAERRISTNYRTKSVLYPCSRIKLFKAPGSFSYRRLLPYLTEISKDYSGDSKVDYCSETEKGFLEQTLLASSCQEKPTEKSKKARCLTQAHETDSCTKLASVSCEHVVKPSTPIQLPENLCNFINPPALRVDEPCPLPQGDGEIYEAQKLKCSNCDLSSCVEPSHVTNEDILVGLETVDIKIVNDVEARETDAGFSSSDKMSSMFLHNVHPCEDYETRDCSGIVKLPEAEEMKEIKKNSFDTQQYHAFSDTEGNNKCIGDRKRNDDGEGLDQDLNEKDIPTTPSNADIFCRGMVDKQRGNGVDCVLQAVNPSFMAPVSGSSLRGDKLDISQRKLYSGPKSKTVPNGSSRQNLTTISGSFSYRRLLPFLMKISKENSCASEIDQLLKTEKNFSEKPVSPFSTSGSLESSDVKSSSNEHHTSDISTSMAVIGSTARSLPADSIPWLVSPSNVANILVPLDSEQEKRSVLNHADMDENAKRNLNTSDSIIQVEPPSVSSCALTCPVSLLEGSKLVSDEVLVNTKEDCFKSMAKCTSDVNPVEKNESLEASVPAEVPATSHIKGILRRNRTGCRGICSCLNCSSFRLHVERAFEFSRNQMRYAEEVATDLIRELSSLRNILGNSSSSSNDSMILCMRQVKEACKNAFAAEEVARTRLAQMKDDLNCHCRFTCGERPRVRFAIDIREQVAPIVGALKNQSEFAREKNCNNLSAVLR